MQHLRKEREPLAVALYAAAGLLPALALRPMADWAADVHLPRVLPTVVLVNVAIPAMILATAAWYPRVRTLWVGSALALLLFTLERKVEGNWRVWEWDVRTIPALFHPIVCAAMAASAVLGTFVIAAICGVRRIGRADAHLRCRACEYLTVDLSADRCPECGGPR